MTFEWIPREANKHADHLANRAMDIGEGKPSHDRPALRAAAAAGPPPPSWIAARGHADPPDPGPARLDRALAAAALLRPQRSAAVGAGRAAGAGPGPAGVVVRTGRRGRHLAAAARPPDGRRHRRRARPARSKTSDGLVETDFGDWEGLSAQEVPQPLAGRVRRLARIARRCAAGRRVVRGRRRARAAGDATRSSPRIRARRSWSCRT